MEQSEEAAEAQRDGRAMAQEVMLGGRNAVERSRGWLERTRVHMHGPHARAWLDGVLDGVGCQMALDDVEDLDARRSTALGAHVLQVGPEAWGVQGQDGRTLMGHLAHRSLEDPGTARDALAVAGSLRDAVPLGGSGAPGLRNALAQAASAPGRDQRTPLDHLRTTEGAMQGQARSTADGRLAETFERWALEAGPGGSEAARAGDEVRKRIGRAHVGQEIDPTEAIRPLAEVAPGPARTEVALRIAARAARIGVYGTSQGAPPPDMRPTIRAVLELAQEGPGRGIETTTRATGTNLLHRVADTPKAANTMRKVIAELPGGREALERMEATRSLAGPTPAQAGRRDARHQAGAHKR